MARLLTCGWLEEGSKVAHLMEKPIRSATALLVVKQRLFDIQATILNQLGFDHKKFTYESQGRPFRLTDVSGKVLTEILS